MIQLPAQAYSSAKSFAPIFSVSTIGKKEEDIVDRSPQILDARLLLADLSGSLQSQRRQWIVGSSRRRELESLLDRTLIALSQAGFGERLPATQELHQHLSLLQWPGSAAIRALDHVMTEIETLETELEAALQAAGGEGWRPLERSSDGKWKRQGTRRQSYKANNAAG